MAKRAVKPLAECEIQVMDSLWKCRLIKPATFKRLHGSGTAVVDFENKILDFDVKEFQLELITHELSHIYYDALPIESTNKIKIEDFEEILCSFMGRHNTVIYEKSNYIFNKFREQHEGVK